MTELVLKGVGQRKLRSALTAIAVLLGVAMIAGTYVLTDQIRSGFTDLQRSVYSGVDVEVAPKDAFTSQFSQARPLNESLVAQIEAIPGVRLAEGDLWAAGALVIDGKLKKSAGGGGTIIATASSGPFKPVSNIKGRMPEQSGEVALLRDTADKYGLEPGDRLGIASRHGVAPVTVVGSYEIGSADAGGTDWSRRRSTTSSVGSTVRARSPQSTWPPTKACRPSSSRADQPRVPARLEVRTGEDAADQNAAEINDQIGGFLTPALLTFAGAALLVGAFIIFNTFTITVAERTREFALLRTLGATRRQILGAVALEALVLGLTASLLGMGLGLLFAKGARVAVRGRRPRHPDRRARARAAHDRRRAPGRRRRHSARRARARRGARRASPPIAALQRGDPARRRAAAAGRLDRRRSSALLGVGAARRRPVRVGGPAASRLVVDGASASCSCSSASRSARAGSSGRSPARSAGRSSACSPSPACSRARTRCATPAAPPPPPRRSWSGSGSSCSSRCSRTGSRRRSTQPSTAWSRADLIVRSETIQPIPAARGRPWLSVAGRRRVLRRADRPGRGERQGARARHRHHQRRRPGASAASTGSTGCDGDDSLLARLRGDNALIEEQFAKTHGVGVGDRSGRDAAGRQRAAARARRVPRPADAPGHRSSPRTCSRASPRRATRG